ncbi:hypothetical protein HBI55_016780 [Parastagonospora nodorum]|nr:hypothetical protein HBI09_017960 [Parastagonospora nodorum]KAH4214243.1 hypothetical protein HBI95_005390 [Parastagonospora nodorum]KAH5021988.1 hypothetical protein HBI77_029000 [Parastagonospora nodorum]KAH5036582.1 hypothetical protein HBI74_052910 [Parastagonospora nodorum]KAH5116195.1 hypothetical protein HBH71_119580 [Parastagonospora nodorum]
MRAVALLGLLCLQLALPVIAIRVTSCQKDNLAWYKRPDTGDDYFHPDSGVVTGTDPPPPPNPRPRPRPRPPPPLPQPPRPPPGVQTASDELWDKAGAKGCTLGWGMQAQDHDAGALYVPERDSARSLYKGTSDLQKWYWHIFPDNKLKESFHDLYATWGIGWVLKDLGISDYTNEYESGRNNLLNIAHQSYEDKALPLEQQWYDIDEEWYPATGASFSFTINPDEGIIISLNRESPKWAVKDRSPPVPDSYLPKLNQFSDVAWITWAAMHKPPWSQETRLNNIKYFMSVSITNVETQQILKRALEANHWHLSEWPGHTFERMWPETKAILGSPNVQGFAYFLIQHKAELGSMFIEQIQVFQGETKAELPCILMHVKQPLGQSAGVKRREAGPNMTSEVQWHDDGKHILRVHTFRANL